jgi:hypothetical protein
MRWSEAGYLSRIVLAHAPRQVSVSLIFDVRQTQTNLEPAVSRVTITTLRGCLQHDKKNLSNPRVDHFMLFRERNITRHYLRYLSGVKQQ